MKINQFMEYRIQVLKALEEYKEVRKNANINDNGLSASVERKADPFVKGHFTLAIVGKMSAGKSTFINAFLGNKNILPTGHFQTTCVLTKIEYAEEESIEIVYGDNHTECIKGDISGKLGKIVAIEDDYSSLPVNDINKLIIKGWNKAKICNPKIIKGMEETSCRAIEKTVLERYIDSHPKSKVAKEVTIKYPLPEDCKGWRIVDTPGVEAVGGIDIETIHFLTAKTETGGNNVDAIIFLHKGTDNIEDKSINDFVKNVFKTLSDDAKKRIFFVVTNAADDTFQNNEEEYMRKAKALFVDPYGIKPDRLLSVDSLMEILYRYVTTEHKDVVTLLETKTAPDSSWNEQVWKKCRSLLRDIRDTLEDADKNLNNENLTAVIQNWSNFDKLRTILNEFVKTEKTNAYYEFLETVYEDIEICVKHRKNDIALLQNGTDEMQGQIRALKETELEKNLTLSSIRKNFDKNAIKERFAFIEQRVESNIESSNASFRDIRREVVNIYDLTDAKKATLFVEMALEFNKYVKVGTSKVFFKRPDFEEIEKSATENSKYKEDVKNTRKVPGMCCDDYEEYTEHAKGDVDTNKKLRLFRTETVRHIRQEANKFKEDIQKEVDTYVSQVNDSLQQAIDDQKTHLSELMEKFAVSSEEQLNSMIAEANNEVALMTQFLNSISKYKYENANN